MKKGINFMNQGVITFSYLQDHKDDIEQLAKKHPNVLSFLVKNVPGHSLTLEQQKECFRTSELKKVFYLWHINHEDERPEEYFELAYIISFLSDYGITRLNQNEKDSLKQVIERQANIIGEVRFGYAIADNIPFDVQRFMIKAIV